MIWKGKILTEFVNFIVQNSTLYEGAIHCTYFTSTVSTLKVCHLHEHHPETKNSKLNVK